MHAAHHLDARGAVRRDLVEREAEAVLPRRKRHRDAQRPRHVAERAELEPPTAEPLQQVADLIERLHGGRRIVDGR